MLSRRLRPVVLAATVASALLLSLPSFAKAIWITDECVSPDGGTVGVTVFGDRRSTAQSVTLSYDSDGPSYSGPATVTIPANASSASFPVTVGAGNVGECVWVGSNGPTTGGATFIWVE